MLEKILLILIALGALGKLGPIVGSGIVLTFGALILSFIYFVFGFAVFTGIRLRNISKKESYTHLKPYDIIISIFTGFIFQSLIMSLLFQLQYWPGAAVMSLATVLSAPIFLILSAVLLMTKNRYIYSGILARGVPMFLLLLVLYLSPVNAKLKIFKVGSPEMEAQILNNAKEADAEN